MQKAHLLTKGAILRTFFTIIQMIVAFFMMPFVINQLGDEWYGIWVIVGSIVGYYYLLDFGLASAVSRYVAKYVAQHESDKVNNIVNTSLVIYIFLSLVIITFTGGVVSVIGFFIEKPEVLFTIRVVLIVVGIQLAFEFPFKAFAGIIQAHLRFDLITYSQFFTLALNTGCIVYFLNKGYGILSLAIIGCVTSFCSNIIFYYMAKFIFTDLKINFSYFSRGKVKELFSYSMWSFIIQIANQLRLRIDSVVLAMLLTTTHVTHYFIGARLVEYYSQIFYRATNMFTPVFAAYHAKGEFNELREKFLFLSRISLVLASYGAGIIIIWGRPFILRWMGETYVDTYPVLIILIIAIMFNLFCNPILNVLYAINKHRFLAMVNLGEGLCNLVLSIILIKYYGMAGCAIGTAVPMIFTRVFILPAYVSKQIRLPLKQYYMNLLPSILLVVGYFYLYYIIIKDYLDPLYVNMILCIICSVPLYLLSAFVISFNKTERKMILSYSSKFSVKIT